MKKKVLIVEDEVLIGLMLAESVRDLGGKVTGVVATGQEAVRAVTEERPDAILMDISLDGGMDGIETARNIQAIKEIPILFLTGFQDPQLFARARLVKPAGIVDKLESSEAIQEAIQALLR